MQKKKARLEEDRLKIITKVRKNMQTKPLTAQQYKRLNGRFLIEGGINIHKNVCQIAYTRHRAPVNAVAHILGPLVAYTFIKNKPTFLPSKNTK